MSKPLARLHCPSFFCRSRAVTSFAKVYPKITSLYLAAGTSLQIRPITMASSASWSTRSLIRGQMIVSLGPITEVFGLIKIIGSLGTTESISAAWSA